MTTYSRGDRWFRGKTSKPALALGLMLLATACRESTARPQPPAQRVVVAPVERRDVPLHVEAVGTVDGYINVELRARVRGLLQAQHYLDGNVVRKGRLLFSIDPSEYQAALESARAAVARAETAAAHTRAQLLRRTDLGAARIVSQQEVEDAHASARDAVNQLRAARASLRQAQLNLSYTEIRSPLEGVAGFASVRAGNLVGQDGPTLLATVSQVDPIRVSFPLSEIEYVRVAERIKRAHGRDEAWARTQFARMAEGEGGADTNSLQLMLADGRVFPHRGVVMAVNRQIDRSTGTIAVEALFPNPDSLLRPGQFARVRLARPDVGAAAIVVPEAAVLEVQGKQTVAVVRPGGKVQMRTVEIGPAAEGWRIVTAGVQPGEHVVIAGLQKVNDGSTVVATLALRSSSPTPADGKGSP